MDVDRPALYPVDSPDFETMYNTGFDEVHYRSWAKVLSDEEDKIIFGSSFKEFIEGLNEYL